MTRPPRSEADPNRSDVIDLVIVTVLVVLAIVVTIPSVFDGLGFRAVFGPVLVLVLPGYAAVAALFPADTRERGASSPENRKPKRHNRREIDGLERIVLSIGLSVLLSSFVGFLLALSPIGLTLEPIVSAIGGVTLSLTAAAWVRRRRLRPKRRFTVPVRSQYGTFRAAIVESTRRDLILRAMLAVSLLLAVGAVTYTLFAPVPDERFTEFYLLTQNGTGAAVAADYPLEYARGESRPITVGLTNHEGEPVDYTVIVQLQQVRTDRNETTVIRRERLHRFDTQVESNGTWTRRHAITPNLVGRNVRVVYLLYRGTPPPQPTTENAYRDLRLDITVTGA